MQPTPSREQRLNSIPDWQRSWVRYSDDLFRVPGTRWRFGLDGLVGLLLPGLGDGLGGALALSLLVTAWRNGASAWLLTRMALNIGIDVLVGMVPLLGDAFDFGFKANRRNLKLLETHLLAPRRVERASRWLLLAVLSFILLLSLTPFLLVYLLWQAANAGA